MDQPTYLTISHLRIALGITWYLLERYLELGIIPAPDAAAAGERPLWLDSRVPEIQSRINEYHRQVEAAKANTLEKI